MIKYIILIGLFLTGCYFKAQTRYDNSVTNILKTTTVWELEEWQKITGFSPYGTRLENNEILCYVFEDQAICKWKDLIKETEKEN